MRYSIDAQVLNALMEIIQLASHPKVPFNDVQKALTAVQNDAVEIKEKKNDGKAK